MSKNVVIALDDSFAVSDLNPDSELERLYKAERNSIRAYLLYLGLRPAQAQEATQEVFLRLHEKMRRGEIIENARAWLFRVAHNLGTRIRARERGLFVPLDDWEPVRQTSSSVEEDLLRRERNQRVAEVLEKLSPQQRNCLYLRSEGLRYREIAEVLGISLSTVNEFLRRAIGRLAEAANG